MSARSPKRLYPFLDSSFSSPPVSFGFLFASSPPGRTPLLPSFSIVPAVGSPHVWLYIQATLCATNVGAPAQADPGSRFAAAIAALICGPMDGEAVLVPHGIQACHLLGKGSTAASLRTLERRAGWLDAGSWDVWRLRRPITYGTERRAARQRKAAPAGQGEGTCTPRDLCVRSRSR
ncbi:hypothetical protein L207DRAFT_600202 [Hyaloscypha variabilis F]|uniref:Uncharacterized protein n=1 Tax=Hyaloscypha variabilis (strain UAMH 11265 / GT02V1 / F) TaxID=1149755 RepID=A0A2J6RGI4_HYAVF|nr:hypothetical protein L207DRAFT_600202 [Hyaloscypha variabilis F]